VNAQPRKYLRHGLLVLVPALFVLGIAGWRIWTGFRKPSLSTAATGPARHRDPHQAHEPVPRSELLRKLAELLSRSDASTPSPVQCEEARQMLAARPQSGYSEIGGAICNPREASDFRFRLLNLLAALGTKEAGDTLRGIVNRRDIDPTFWKLALLRMKEYPTEASVRTAEALLNEDLDWAPRPVVYGLIASYPCDLSRELLLRATDLESDGPSRSMAIRALGPYLRDEGVLSRLFELAASAPSEDSRIAAILCLAGSTEQKVDDFLSGLLSRTGEPDSVKRAAMNGLTVRKKNKGN